MPQQGVSQCLLSPAARWGPAHLTDTAMSKNSLRLSADLHEAQNGLNQLSASDNLPSTLSRAQFKCFVLK